MAMTIILFYVILTLRFPVVLIAWNSYKEATGAAA